MKTITKKEFIDLLAERKSILLGSFWDLREERKTKIINTAVNYKRTIARSDSDYIRTCIKRQSNALQFSNHSWLYFNTLKGSICFKHNNVILSIKKRYDVFGDDFSDDIVYDILVYLID